MKRKKKRHVTLIEIMIVIVLIGLIGGALAFNMRGSMDEGRAFKTKQNQQRIKDILTLEHASGEKEGEAIAIEWTTFVTNSPLVKGSEILKDGWGKQFSVTYTADDFIVKSEQLQKHEAKKHGEEKKK